MKPFLFPLLGGFAFMLLLVHAQDDQTGFISIDCGLAENTSYTEKMTGINYISDETFISTGENNVVLQEYRNKYQEPYMSLRSFPGGIRNCYKINVTNGTKYLIRSSFKYGNYDRQNILPEFDLQLGTNVWDLVKNLSSSGLTGEIAPYISNLTMIHILDLSNNNLTGSIPDFLSRLRKLMVLNLEKNKLTGSVPVGLIQKRKDERFTYPEIVEITSNFKSIIGRGGFGEVYFGTLQNQTQVAVKLLISSSTQGSKEFENEVKLLMRAHHRNLVALVGYCDEGETMALVYNFVANGNLQQRLSADVTLHVLTWKERLQIAVDAARGLDYLHNGCKPSIVHRDLKTSNILLNENLHAMTADFGLSKVFATESATHVSTDPKGTFGYLDPQYYYTGKLKKRSDIYSFGIVLLELITGTYNTSSAWKALQIAMACVSLKAIQRPDITFIYKDLKECLEIEMSSGRAQIVGNDDTSSSSSIRMASQIESETSSSSPVIISI
ncbi:PREDICTED: probable LRR receptor-like serine/threonine-protein kinase At1g51820 [Prunus mume]|uniref:non-specific serine/threonine protein kinase n=1 Tax=Prunus mume TaxID=102107 RepID=A0ABM1LNK1_PRUMU|nr:PREDICTED: probable LRR receptor-like serine/threonine-protein kinase At1g51820 [Prunus mume]